MLEDLIVLEEENRKILFNSLKLFQSRFFISSIGQKVKILLLSLLHRDLT